MCAIAGIVTKYQDINKIQFEEMVDLVSYRGPDDRGIFYDDNVALGHRRLAIVDLSDAGHQPFRFDRYVLVFNGEIYNYVELRKELESCGYTFSTESDTEVLAAAYDKWGRDCVYKFNGMWAFGVYDTEKRELFCSRDRFGIKPLYYYADEEIFVFGSEIKQLLMMKAGKNKVNRKRLMEFLIGGIQDYSSETMFDGIYQLSPGTNLKLDKNTWDYKCFQWYDLSKVTCSNKSYMEAVTEFRKLFTESVKMRLRADVPVGFCLSGGLDSSSIVCIADELEQNQNQKKGETDDHRKKMHSVSSCFEGQEYASYDEQEYIDEVVEKTGIISHKVYPKFEDLFSGLDEIIWHMDTPFSSTSVFAQWNVFREAKEKGITVMLDGQGADEQLAGYIDFESLLMGGYLRKVRLDKFVHEYYSYKNIRSESGAAAQRIFLLSIRDALFPNRIKRQVTKYFLKKGKMKIPFRTEEYLDFKEKFVSDNKPERFILNQLKFGLSGLLQYEDRNSMAHSIESRVPFLDYRLVEEVFSYPIEFKIRDGKSKILMRDALRGIIPDKIRNRYSKLGFVTPEDKWIRDNREYFLDELMTAADRLYPLIEKERVEAWARSEAAFERGNFTMWRIICAAHWANIFHVEI